MPQEVPTPPKPATNEEFKMVLQLETSLLGWLRTSLSLMGFGFVIARFGLFLREVATAVDVNVKSHPWLARVSTVSGTALIVLGVVIMLIAVHNHRRTMERLKTGELAFPGPWSMSVVVCLLLSALGMGIATYIGLL